MKATRRVAALAFYLERMAGAVQGMRMASLTVRLADLAFLSPHELNEGLSPAEITEILRRQFDFLPGEVELEISDGAVTIQFESASTSAQTEAQRLFGKAAKRARNGEFQKAKDIYARVLELDPAMADAHRELAMTLLELGEMDAAREELINALRLRPDDAWSYVVLGNLYAQHDLATAARFFNRTLELNPSDAYALNSLAGVSHQMGETTKALGYFDKAITAHPEFANAWVGKAMLLHTQEQPAQVAELLETMFRRTELLDAHSGPIFAEGRKLYLNAQLALAEAQLSDAFTALGSFKAEVAALSGFPVSVRTEDLPGQLSGVSQSAWKHGRDHHLVQVSERFAAPNRQHLEAREVSRIRLETLARQAGRNWWFTPTDASRELVMRSLAPDLKKLQRQGYSGESVTRVVSDLVRGLCECLFNAPLDMWIETLLHRELPALRPAQFVSLHRLAEEAFAATTQPKTRLLTPPKILRATTALNGAAALFLDDFTHGATDFWPLYQRLEGASLSPRLFAFWQEHRDALQPGDESDLIDAFADILDLRGWYEWQPDPGA